MMIAECEITRVVGRKGIVPFGETVKTMEIGVLE